MFVTISSAARVFGLLAEYDRAMHYDYVAANKQGLSPYTSMMHSPGFLQLFFKLSWEINIAYDRSKALLVLLF